MPRPFKKGSAGIRDFAFNGDVRRARVVLVGEDHTRNDDIEFVDALLQQLLTGRRAVFMMECFTSTEQRFDDDEDAYPWRKCVLGGDSVMLLSKEFSDMAAGATGRRIGTATLQNYIANDDALQDAVGDSGGGDFATRAERIRMILQLAEDRDIPVYGLDLQDAPKEPAKGANQRFLNAFNGWNYCRDPWMCKIIENYMKTENPGPTNRKTVFAFIGADHIPGFQFGGRKAAKSHMGQDFKCLKTNAPYISVQARDDGPRNTEDFQLIAQTAGDYNY
jgi:hypothetical protein